MDLSPNFAGSLMGITNTVANICSILAPLIASIIIKDTVCIIYLYILFTYTLYFYLLLSKIIYFSVCNYISYIIITGKFRVLKVR